MPLHIEVQTGDEFITRFLTALTFAQAKVKPFVVRDHKPRKGWVAVFQAIEEDGQMVILGFRDKRDAEQWLDRVSSIAATLGARPH
jgi:hypothetical protein